MKWILIAWLMGSLVTSVHDTEEQCEGRRAMLSKEKNVSAPMCVRSLPSTTTLTNGTITNGVGDQCFFGKDGWTCR